PDIENVSLAIARTAPGYAEQPEVREIECQNLDAFAAARREIYIENQYVTATQVGDALSARLGERDGPEVVIVTSRDSTDWIENATMGVLRGRLLDRLRAADRHDRLRVYYPVVPDIGERYVKVHSKVLIVDGVFARIGSSNLCNRSMGIDTECDVAIEAGGDPSVRSAVELFRNRLLAEHLGVSVEEFARALGRERSLIRAIERLRSGERTLEDLDGAVVRWLDGIMPGQEVIDPPWPLSAPGQWFPLVYPEDVRGTAQYSLVVSVLLVLAVAGLGVAWRWTPLGEAIQPEQLSGLASTVRDHPAAPLVVTGAYVAGTALMIPLNLMIFATALTFRPGASFAYAWVGAVVAGAATYAVGRMLGRNIVRRLGGDRAIEVTRRIAQQGLLAVTALRLLPVAPYGVVNLMAGAAEVRFLDYTLGTGIGLLPGIAAITLFGAQLERTLERPGFGSIALLGGMALAMLGGSWALGRWLRRSESVAHER
ncbi:MAG: VTT domain-containing protein, partial [Candidatus Binatia bacterium]